MSKKEEILHKLITEDRNYIKEKFKEKDQRITELEEKLAESEKTIEELKGERLKVYTDDVRRTRVINGVHFDIEQLLVFSEYVEHEKWVISNRDKEIEELNKQLLYKDKEISVLKSQLCLSLISQSIDQDKISFAVEQLEKVRKYLKHKGFVLKVKTPIELPSIKNQEYLNQFNIFVEDFDKIFDNQIEQIKKEMK